MSTTLVLVLVLTFSFTVGRVLHRVASGALLPSSTAYLVLGVLLGPQAAGLLSESILSTLQPLISLLLGLLGFILGLSLRRRLREAQGLEAGLLGCLATLAVVAAATLGYLHWLQPSVDLTEHLWLAMALGAAAAVSDEGMVDAVAARLGAQGPATNLLRTFSLASSVAAVVAFGVSLSLARAHASSGALGLTETEWLVASAGVGIACGLLYALFQGREDDTQRTFLATVAVVTFASGMSSGMGISPLLINAIAGLAVTLVSARATATADALARLERPATIMLLVFAGAAWRPVGGWMWLLPLGWFAVRWLTLRGGASLALRIVGRRCAPQRFGDGLLPQSGLAVAIAINYAQVHTEHAPEVLTVVIAGLVAADLLGPGHLRHVLADAGEAQHSPPQAESAPALPAAEAPEERSA